MPPTLKDIASRANVSPALVSMYLNHNPKSRMSAETRQRIDAAIRELNYRPSALARSLRSGKSMTIGYATGNIVGTFSSFQTQMLLLEAHRYGYQLLISLVPFYDLAQEQKILNNLLDSRPAGILYNLDLKPDEETAGRLEGFPILQTDSNLIKYNSLTWDPTRSMSQAIQLFAEEGKRRLAVTVVAPQGTWYNSATAICRKYDLELIYISDSTANNPQSFFEMLSDCKADCFLAYSSIFVTRLLQYCESRGITRIPACIYTYALPTDYISHPAVRGCIVNPFREHISMKMKRMIEMIADPDGQIEHRKHSSQFMTPAELARYYNNQLEDPYYEPILVVH